MATDTDSTSYRIETDNTKIYAFGNLAMTTAREYDNSFSTTFIGYTDAANYWVGLARGKATKEGFNS